MKKKIRTLISVGVAAMTLGLAQGAQAQDAAPQQDAADSSDIQSADEIVVQAGIGFRNRSGETEPVLVYDYEYFQRFEPLTAGDALKRVPSVTFLSDVIESDGARLRGLDPGYTQILINGEKVPGGNADRSFFLDRIPAELIKQVEIVRSSSARRSGDAIAGTLNIVLRDGYQIDGGYLRAGGLLFDNGRVKPSFGAVYGAPVGPGRVLLGANIQGRYNPKKKKSLRYSDSPENNANYATAAFVNREDQTDTRDGTDYSFNASYEIDTDTTDVSISAYYVRTDRTEDERSYEYNSPTAINGPVRNTVAGNLLSDNANVNEIDQDNYSLTAKVQQEWALGKTTLRGSYARYVNRSNETEFEADFNRSTPRFTGDFDKSRITDDEVSGGLEHKVGLGSGIDLVVGGFLQNKSRYTNVATVRERFNLPAETRNWNQFSQNPTAFAILPPPRLVPEPGNLNSIREDRRDAFALVEGKNGILSWEAGLRYETTKVHIHDRTVATGGTQRTDYDFLLPSASVKLQLTETDRVTLSGARTNRRPRLDFISPALILAELGDNDLLGNSMLRPELAWGGDLGYEHRIGRTGVVGINVFYRDITDLVEIANTGVTGSEGKGTFVLQPRNTGNGKVYGVEFDLSTDLGFLGLKNTGVFGNVSWLDSKITDFAGERRFNGQSKFVYNAGFIQNLPTLAAAFGATYRKQGDALDRLVSEEVTTSYGADLEIFIEKRLGKSVTIRAVGSNLLDGHKDEVFNKFTTIKDQADRAFDEYELESENAGPVFQLMARVAF